eukprot:4292019-Pleurochrysis_carterae.AAC.3
MRVPRQRKRAAQRARRNPVENMWRSGESAAARRVKSLKRRQRAAASARRATRVKLLFICFVASNCPR